MAADIKNWESYEEVAQFLLNQMAERFSLGRVEGKQVVGGESGTTWEIDAKGVLEGEEGFIIIECRRYTASRLSQEQIAALAYRIRDTRARGGITVSPLDLQAGAKLVAARENITHVRLTAESTTSDYMLQFLNQVFVGLSGAIAPQASLRAKVFRADGTLEERKLK